jgi:hypothetical protein
MSARATSSCYVFVVCAGFIALAGCGETTQSGLPFPAQSDSVTAHNPATGASWMAPGATTQELLYVTDRKTNSVSVYSYPSTKQEGQLTGFKHLVFGLCSDAQGDVFLPVGHKILEYAHGGTRPTATLRDPYDGNEFCAVDPTTGNLAVPGVGGFPRWIVAVYTHAKGRPRAYAGAGMSDEFYACTYGNRGNLFVNGLVGSLEAVRPAQLAVTLAKLRQGGTRLRLVQGGRTPYIGSIQWNDQDLVESSSLSESGPAAIYRYSVSQGQATLVGTTTLNEAGSVGQFWIQGATVIVPSGGAPSTAFSAVLFYNYPAGGNPIGRIDDPNEPFGATISLAPSKK